MKLAFCGRMQAGKTTAANYLVEKYSFKLFRFAQGVRDIGNIVKNGENPDYITQEIIEYGKLPKKLYSPIKTAVQDIFDLRNQPERVWLQKLGSEGFRDGVDKQFWVNVLSNNEDFQKRVIHGYNVAIDDLRFVNESVFCKQLLFNIVKIDVNKDNQIKRFQANGKMNTTEKDMEHQSEKQVKDIKHDYLINGNLPLEYYLREVDELYRRLYDRNK